jgi:hypothetical protein
MTISPSVPPSRAATRRAPARLVHQIGVARSGIAEIDGEAMRKTARKRLGTDIGAEMHFAHAVNDGAQGFEIGMDRRTLDFRNVVAKADKDAVPDHR